MPTDSRIASRATVGVAGVLLVLIAFLVGRATTTGQRPPVVPGPDRVVNGVSVGFADTEIGAEAAAAHYLLELERGIDTLRLQRTAAVAELVATAAEWRAIAAHASDVVALERSGGAPLRRVAIATDPVAYSPGVAQVTVLESWLYASASREVVWAVERVSLAWQRGDWRVSAIAGAAPSSNESLAELRAQLAFPGPGDASIR